MTCRQRVANRLSDTLPIADAILGRPPSRVYDHSTLRRVRCREDRQ